MITYIISIDPMYYRNTLIAFDLTLLMNITYMNINYQSKYLRSYSILYISSNS